MQMILPGKTMNDQIFKVSTSKGLRTIYQPIHHLLEYGQCTL